MRKICMWVIFFLLVFPLAALAEEALFPAKGENGLWGYINARGEFVIAPQYDGAGEFRGDYASVTIYPHEEARERSWGYDAEGIIDRQGNFVLPPEYSIDGGYDGEYYGGKDTGIWCVTKYETENDEISLYGFFDIPSGTFSGLKWDQVYPWYLDLRLIPVIEDMKTGYADRTTGEMVIPCQYFAADPDNFYNGYACVAFVDEDWNPLDFFLINEEGEQIPMPEGYSAVQYDSRVSEGLVFVRDGDYNASYMNLNGEIVFSTGYEGTVYPFHEGFAVVNYDRYMNRDGEILEGITARPEELGGYEFVNGLTSVFYHEKPAAMNTDGEIVFVLEEENIFWLWNFMDNGLAWYMEWHFEQGRAAAEQMFYGLVDAEGNILCDGVWIPTRLEGSPFSDGLAVVKPMEGPDLYGYLNEKGELVLPAVYEEAEPFENGLAYVELENRCGYIDTNGKEVYFWQHAGK